MNGVVLEDISVDLETDFEGDFEECGFGWRLDGCERCEGSGDFWELLGTRRWVANEWVEGEAEGGWVSWCGGCTRLSGLGCG